jgi:hypothetical protein
MAIGIGMVARNKSPLSIQIAMLVNWASRMFYFGTHKLTATLWQRRLKKSVVVDEVGADNDRADKEDPKGWRAYGYPTSSLDDDIMQEE